jgi:methanethiol S-methyltransferase
LLFSFVNTSYILIGLRLEERDLITQFGATYQEYRRRVPMLLPRIFNLHRSGARQ